MPTAFDPGYGAEPFRTLVEEVPDGTVFPLKDFRVEWGPCSTEDDWTERRGC